MATVVQESGPAPSRTMDSLTPHHLRISLLWVLSIVALFAYSTFAGNESAENVANLSLVSDQDLANTSLILMLFAVLALLLPGRLSRSVNLVAAIVFAIIFTIVLVDGLDVHSGGTYNQMMGADVVLAVLIGWLAYRLPANKGK